MIFVNRRRIKQNSGVVKDPSTYWYVEKYVYGVLKETVEVKLGSGTTFGTMDSGFDDDEFYGWSVDSTSTTRKFNATSTYKNTTTNVKNNLDDENTLKIYAIYKYVDDYDISTDTVTSGSVTVAQSGSANFSGNTQKIVIPTSGSSTITTSSLTLNISNSSKAYAKIDDSNVYGTLPFSKDVTIGQVIKTSGETQTGTSAPGNTIYVYTVACTVPHYVSTTKYRVESHINTSSMISGGTGTVTPIN